MDLDEAVDELYGLAPGDFTARRDQLAATAKRGGDADLSRQLRALRRPTASAAALNRLARDAGAELTAYLALGARLREAQAGLRGDELRALGRERQEGAAVLLQTAETLVDGLSAAARQEVDETLRAAVADPAASEAVASGRLTKALSYAGFGEVDITAATATPLARSERPAKKAAANKAAAKKAASQAPANPGSKPSTQGSDSGARVLAERRARAEQELAEAQAAAQAAREAAKAAESAHEDAVQVQSEAEQRVDDLREQLAQARFAVRDAQRQATSASSDRAAAEKAVTAAEKALARARDRLSHLTERAPR